MINGQPLIMVVDCEVCVYVRLPSSFLLEPFEYEIFVFASERMVGTQSKSAQYSFE